MTTDEHPDTDDLAEGAPRGDGLATGSAPQEGIDDEDASDPGATVTRLPRGGEDLADGAA